MIIYDSCYSICNDIITNLGGTNKKWDSVYSQALYIAGLVGVDTPAKKYDSVYSILLDVIPALGGTNKLWDSVYSELKYIAELSGVEDENFDSSYSILTDIVGGSPSPCEKDLNIQFAVITDISSYTDRIYSKVFAKDENKWYMLNNLNEYELYGIYADTFETTTYDGKLTIVDAKEYEYKNGEWQFLGNSTYSYKGAQFDGASFFDTGFKIANNIKAECEFISNNSSTNQTIFGNRTTLTSNQFICFDNGGKLRTDFSNKMITATTSVDTEALYKVEMYATTDGGNTGVYNVWKDGVFLTGGTISINAFSSTARNIYVGNNQDFASYNKGIIKYLKLYNNVDKDGNGTLVHSYTFKDVVGVGKMYDEITGDYLPNKGTGNITILQTGDMPKHYQIIDEPQQIITAATYCDLYKYDNSKLYIGQLGDVVDDDLLYVINSNKRWLNIEQGIITNYDGLTFTALEDDCAIAMNNFGENEPDIKFSFDGENWYNWKGEELVIYKNCDIAFKCSGGTASSDLKFSTFALSGMFNAKGNIMSLLDNGACTATTLVNPYEFNRLFKDCIGLYDAGGLTIPATTLGQSYAYNSLFQGCSNMIHTAPELPALNLSNKSYFGMFSGCTSLLEIPDVKATTPEGANNGNKSMEYMFIGCESLTTAYLPLTSYTSYFPMKNVFENCKSLQSVKLDVQSVGSYPCGKMFKGCSSLTHVDMRYFDKNLSMYSTGGYWMQGCPSYGTFVININGTYTSGSGIPNGWLVVYYDATDDTFWLEKERITQCDEYGNPIPKPLTLTALQDNCRVAMKHSGTNATTTMPDLQYTLDNGNTWENWNGSAITLSNVGDEIQFKSSKLSTNTANYSSFLLSGQTKVSGNIMSLVDDGECTATTIPNAYYFANLFKNCTSLVYAGDLILPAPELTPYCYYYLFSGCVNLVNAPALPATNLSNYCYTNMFRGCTSLTDAPALPATTLKQYCYYYMFEGCTSLTEAPTLAAEVLTAYCYRYLFQNCSNLRHIEALFNYTSTNSTQNWVVNVAPSGVFVKNINATWDLAPEYGVPSGWETIYKDTTDNTYWLDIDKTTQCDKYGNPI